MSHTPLIKAVMKRTVGDKNPAIDVTYSLDSVAVNVTGYTFYLRVTKPNGTTVFEKTGSIVSAPAGTFRFTFLGTEFDVEGRYTAEIEIIDGSANNETWQGIAIDVYDQMVVTP